MDARKFLRTLCYGADFASPHFAVSGQLLERLTRNMAIQRRLEIERYFIIASGNIIIGKEDMLETSQQVLRETQDPTPRSIEKVQHFLCHDQ
jgi:hypothetical protein